MRNKVLLILNLLFFIQCNTNSDNLNLSNDDKIKILADVLNETTELKLFNSDKMLISNYPLMPPPWLCYVVDSINGELKREKSLIRFLSNSLKTYDTTFIKKQITDNKSLDLNLLSEYGFNIFDLKLYHLNGIRTDSIFLVADEFYKKNGIDTTVNSNYLCISKPIFNKENNLMFLRTYNQVSGYSLILKKEQDRWHVINEVEYWIE